MFVNSEWCLSFNRCRGLPKRSSEGLLRLTKGVAVVLKKTVIGATILRIDGRTGGKIHIYIYIYIKLRYRKLNLSVNCVLNCDLYRGTCVL